MFISLPRREENAAPVAYLSRNYEKEGITRFNEINKVEPMKRALRELNAHAWITGVRRSQSSTRQGLQAFAEQNGRIKVHPIYDWSNKDVHQYLTKHDLPYHPL